MYKFRTAPKIQLSKNARWTAVLKLNPQTEIWILDLRTDEPGGYLFIPCTVTQATAKPKAGEFHRKNLGSRFFWYEREGLLVIQESWTTGLFDRETKMRQEFIKIDDGSVNETLEDGQLMFLPNTNYKEIFPEMHPDRERK